MPAPIYKQNIRFDDIAEAVSDVYAHVTDELLVNIASRFRTGKGLASAEWQLAKLAELGALTRENMKIIIAAIPRAREEAEKALQKSIAVALEMIEPEFAEAVKAGLLDGVSVNAIDAAGLSGSAQNIMRALQGQANDVFNLVNTTMLRSSLDAYRKVVSDTLMYERQLGTAQDVINQATAETISGAYSRQAALRRAIKQLSDDGLTGFTDKAGRRWSPEAYVNMDIRTTCGNAATLAVFARNKDYGNDLIYVRSKAAARPLCYPYQGRVFSTSGRSGTVEDLNGNKIRFEPLSSTSYGQPAGLFGINCGHTPPNPFIPSVSKVDTEHIGKAENDEQYALSQRQRLLERKVRAAKREAAMYDATGDKEAFDASAVKVGVAMTEYKAFCSDNDRTQRLDRTQVATYNRSVSSKATASVRRQKAS